MMRNKINSNAAVMSLQRSSSQMSRSRSSLAALGMMVVAWVLVTSIGCGEPEPTIVGGPDPRYEMPEDLQDAYSKSMKSGGVPGGNR
jgi:hypothetical protein